MTSIEIVLDKIKRTLQLNKTDFTQIMTGCDPSNSGVTSFFDFQSYLERKGISFSTDEMQCIKDNFSKGYLLDLNKMRSKLTIDCTDALLQLSRILSFQNATISDVCRPYDRFRSGKIELNTFIQATGQSRLAQSIAPAFLDQNNYVNYRQMEIYLHKASTERKTSKNSLSDSVRKAIQQAIGRRIDLNRLFSDADQHHIGLLDPTRFLTILDISGFNLSPSESLQLASYYARDGRVNYILFIQDVEKELEKLKRIHDNSQIIPKSLSPQECLDLLREEITARHTSAKYLIEYSFGQNFLASPIPLSIFSRKLSLSIHSLNPKQCEILGRHFMNEDKSINFINLINALQPQDSLIPSRDSVTQTTLENNQKQIVDQALNTLQKELVRRHLNIQSILPYGRIEVRHLAKILSSFQKEINPDVCLIIAEYFQGDCDNIVKIMTPHAPPKRSVPVVKIDYQGLVNRAIEAGMKFNDLQSFFLKIDRARTGEITTIQLLEFIQMAAIDGLQQALEEAFPCSIPGVINWQMYLKEVNKRKSEGHAQQNQQQITDQNPQITEKEEVPENIKNAVEYILRCAKGSFFDLNLTFKEIDKFNHGTITINQFYHVMHDIRCDIDVRPVINFFCVNKNEINYVKFLSINIVNHEKKNELPLAILKIIKAHLSICSQDFTELCLPYDSISIGLIPVEKFNCVLLQNSIPMTKEMLTQLNNTYAEKGNISYRRVAADLNNIQMTKEEVRSLVNKGSVFEENYRALAYRAGLELKAKLNERKRSANRIFSQYNGMITKKQFTDVLDQFYLTLSNQQIDAIADFFGDKNLIDIQAFLDFIQHSSLIGPSFT